MRAIWVVPFIVSILILVTSGLSQNVFAACNVCGDFNNDGFDDLPIGARQEALSGNDEGSVNVIYGSAAGLHRNLGHTDQFWTQDSTGIADSAEDFDNFGSFLVIADFNGDTFDDLAIGVPREDFTATNNEGAVNVIYGSAFGLHRSLGHNDQLWGQDSKGIADSGEPNDNFGRVLTAGDFNNDGFDDLVVGVPFEDLPTSAEGVVHVIYGSAIGLHRSLGHNDQLWTQDSGGIADSVESGDAFGGALTVGDFNGDTFDDLAIGVLNEDLSGSNEGAVNVIYGSAFGLHRSVGHNDQFWTQDSKGIADSAENSDRFGEVLAAGDFNNDGFDDLAIGVSGEGLSLSGEGAVNVIYGSAFGLHRSVGHNDQFWTQDSGGIAETAEMIDGFGRSLTVGDFNGDTFDDLAIGTPNESLSGSAEGAVNVIYGSAAGLHRSLGHNDQLWTQDSKGIADISQTSDSFGNLSAGDFNNDGFDDLVIGVVGEDLSVSNQGAVNVIYGSASGLHRDLGHADQLWSQDSGGIADTGEAFDCFAYALPGSFLFCGD